MANNHTGNNEGHGPGHDLIASARQCTVKEDNMCHEEAWEQRLIVECKGALLVGAGAEEVVQREENENPQVTRMRRVDSESTPRPDRSTTEREYRRSNIHGDGRRDVRGRIHGNVRNGGNAGVVTVAVSCQVLEEASLELP